jgi:Ran-binding protein 3
VTNSSTSQSGFMAYASTSSPFASVKGRNIFKKSSPSFSSFSSSPPQPTTHSTLDSQAASPSTSTTRASVTPLKAEATEILSGFDTPLTSGSLFSPVRRPISPPVSESRHKGSKSPSRRSNTASVNAFSSYAVGGAQGFHVPKRARAISPSGGSSRSSIELNLTRRESSFNEASDSGVEDEEDKTVGFGEKLRAGKDEENDGGSDEEKGKVVLTEQEGASVLPPLFVSP